MQARTAWDDFFSKLNSGCWVQVILNDDSRVGGQFDTNSFASAYPDPGHIYIEALWEVDAQGRFVQQVDGKPGMILRPEDYKYIQVYV